MFKINLVQLLAVLGMFVTVLDIAVGCMCQPDCLAERFCNTALIVKVRVLAENTEKIPYYDHYVDGKVTYSAQIVKIYKNVKTEAVYPELNGANRKQIAIPVFNFANYTRTRFRYKIGDQLSLQTSHAHSCGRWLTVNDNYIVANNPRNDQINVDYCSFVAKATPLNQQFLHYYSFLAARNASFCDDYKKYCDSDFRSRV